MLKNKWLHIGILLIIISTTWYILEWLFLQKEEVYSQNKNPIDTKKKIYNHTFAEKLSKNDFFKWTFISNDTAAIYPRREALVKDILVDIWDKIEVWQTLAILFDPWVSWEAQSKINITQTIVTSKNNTLKELINVKNAKISEFDQKISEKQKVLDKTIQNYDTKIYQIWDTSTNYSEYQVLNKSLENLEKNLENAQESKKSLINQSKDNIIQKEILLNAKIEEIFNNIIPILYIWNETELSYNTIKNWDISDQFWAKNTTLKNKLIQEIKIFHENYLWYSTEKKYQDIQKINDILISTLQNTIVSVSITEATLKSKIADINIYKNQLIRENEILEDAKNKYFVLDLAQKEKIDNISTLISQKENEIALVLTRSNSTQSDKSLAITKLKEEILTLKKSKELVIANENKSITDIENEISIARAQLNNVYIESWNYTIKSPFSGIISKRSIQIGQKISQNTQAFRISWVDSTLSRITKKEVKFYVPENIKDNIYLNKEVRFYIPDNNKSFTGTIYRISPEIDTETSNIIVQAKVDESILLPNNSTLRVKLETQQEIFKLPSSTIYNKEKRKIIYYKKDNGKLWVRDITIISNDGEYSLVTWKISENLPVVTTPIFIK